MRSSAGFLVLMAGSSGCAVTPLTGKIDIDHDPYIMVVGEGTDGNTDLFAAPAGGGQFVRVSFNRLVENLPRLAPNGKAVAFLRRPTSADSVSETLVSLDLATMVETERSLPREGRAADRLGWTSDGDLVVGFGDRLWIAEVGMVAGPLRLVPLDSVPKADSATRQLLGDPPMGVVTPCRAEGGAAAICIEVGGVETRLPLDATEAIRWGADSVAYVTGTQIVVRPLGAGRARAIRLTQAPARLRHPTYFGGSAPRSDR